MTTFPRLVVCVMAVGLGAACSSGGTRLAAVQNPAKPLSVEQLAAKVGCAPRIQVNATDMRQAYCKTVDGEFFLTTFTTQAGKDAWMDTAPEYNPHLVGYLWTALSSRQVLELLKERLGGDLHLKDHRTMKTIN
ncbi:hypothetical protein ACIBHX_03940 [Nonomuraea sp. NPDC050536]|uniref:hypothetical protein n=1 Tax=Nonomuraea sp. NPDC050536 TaxID=3364366 RepID=UPI0037CA759A